MGIYIYICPYHYYHDSFGYNDITSPFYRKITEKKRCFDNCTYYVCSMHLCLSAAKIDVCFFIVFLYFYVNH